MLLKGRIAGNFASAKQTRGSRREVALKTSKAQGESQDAPPKRLMPRDIRLLGGLKRATQLVNDFQEKRSGKRSDAAVSKKFRKPKKTPAEIAAEKEQVRQAEIQKAPQHLKNLYGSKMNKNPPLVVIDGYNVLAEMVEQDRIKFRGKELCEQRALLETDVRIFSQIRGIRACVVYDALRNPNPDVSKARQTEFGVDSVYCMSYEADKGLRIESERSSRLFLKEVRECKKFLQETVEENNLTPRRSPLKSSLSGETHSELQKMRKELGNGTSSDGL